jgi:protein involved in polysaccharide export with SLBB domain
METANGIWWRAIRLGQVFVSLSVVLWMDAAQRGLAQSPANTAAPASSATFSSEGHYLIGPDDVLEIRVFNRPQLSREAVRVDGRGMIRMPMIEQEIQAACRIEASWPR